MKSERTHDVDLNHRSRAERGGVGLARCTARSGRPGRAEAHTGALVARAVYTLPGRAAARPARRPRLHRAHARQHPTLHRHRRRYPALARGGEPD